MRTFLTFLASASLVFSSPIDLYSRVKHRLVLLRSPTAVDLCGQNLQTCAVIDPTRLGAPWKGSLEPYPQCYDPANYVCVENFLCPGTAPTKIPGMYACTAQAQSLPAPDPEPSNLSPVQGCGAGVLSCDVIDPSRLEAPWKGSTSSFPQCYDPINYVCVNNFLCPMTSPLKVAGQYACAVAPNSGGGTNPSGTGGSQNTLSSTTYGSSETYRPTIGTDSTANTFPASGTGGSQNTLPATTYGGSETYRPTAGTDSTTNTSPGLGAGSSPTTLPESTHGTSETQIPTIGTNGTTNIPSTNVSTTFGGSTDMSTGPSATWPVGSTGTVIGSDTIALPIVSSLTTMITAGHTFTHSLPGGSTSPSVTVIGSESITLPSISLPTTITTDGHILTLQPQGPSSSPSVTVIGSDTITLPSISVPTTITTEGHILTLQPLSPAIPSSSITIIGSDTFTLPFVSSPTTLTTDGHTFTLQPSSPGSSPSITLIGSDSITLPTVSIPTTITTKGHTFTLNPPSPGSLTSSDSLSLTIIGSDTITLPHISSPTTMTTDGHTLTLLPPSTTTGPTGIALDPEASSALSSLKSVASNIVNEFDQLNTMSNEWDKGTKEERRVIQNRAPPDAGKVGEIAEDIEIEMETFQTGGDGLRRRFPSNRIPESIGGPLDNALNTVNGELTRVRDLASIARAAGQDLANLRSQLGGYVAAPLVAFALFAGIELSDGGGGDDSGGDGDDGGGEGNNEGGEGNGGTNTGANTVPATGTNTQGGTGAPTATPTGPPTFTLPPQVFTDTHNIVSFDGEDLRSLSEVFQMREIMRLVRFDQDPDQQYGEDTVLSRPYQHFDLMAGTGFGALLAVMFGRLRLSPDEVLFVLNQSAGEQGPGGLELEFAEYRLEENRLTGDLGRNADNIRSFVTRLLQNVGSMPGHADINVDSWLNDGGQGSRVAITMVESGGDGERPSVWRSYTPQQAGAYDDLGAITIREALVGALTHPRFMTPTTINGRSYEGGMNNFNSPGDILFQESLVEFPKEYLSLFLSLGSGYREESWLNPPAESWRAPTETFSVPQFFGFVLGRPGTQSPAFAQLTPRHGLRLANGFEHGRMRAQIQTRTEQFLASGIEFVVVSPWRVILPLIVSRIQHQTRQIQFNEQDYCETIVIDRRLRPQIEIPTWPLDDNNNNDNDNDNPTDNDNNNDNGNAKRQDEDLGECKRPLPTFEESPASSAISSSSTMEVSSTSSSSTMEVSSTSSSSATEVSPTSPPAPSGTNSDVQFGESPHYLNGNFPKTFAVEDGSLHGIADIANLMRDLACQNICDGDQLWQIPKILSLAVAFGTTPSGCEYTIKAAHNTEMYLHATQGGQNCFDQTAKMIKFRGDKKVAEVWVNGAAPGEFYQYGFRKLDTNGPGEVHHSPFHPPNTKDSEHLGYLHVACRRTDSPLEPSTNFAVRIQSWDDGDYGKSIKNEVDKCDKLLGTDGWKYEPDALGDDYHYTVDKTQPQNYASFKMASVLSVSNRCVEKAIERVFGWQEGSLNCPQGSDWGEVPIIENWG